MARRKLYTTFTRQLLIFSESSPTYTLKEQRKILKEWAKDNLIGKELYLESLDTTVSFSISGIKEFLNQPHRHYFLKNESLKEIIKILKAAEYVESRLDETRNENHIFHYLKTTINFEASFIV